MFGKNQIITAFIILINSLSVLYAQPTGTSESGLSVAKKGIWNTKSCAVCWENPAMANDKERSIVRQGVTETWEKFSAFRFTGWGTCNAASKGIRILIADEGPHTKGLGTDLNGKKNGMVLNFTFNEWGKDCTGENREYCIRAIGVHEFGHALGIAHEQNRADAPTACREEQSQGTTGDWILTPYDANSVMNYCNPKWNNGGVLSPADVQGVQKLYGANDFEDRGGLLINEPVACSWGYNRSDAFIVGTDGACYHQYNNGDGWSDYENLGGNFKMFPIPTMMAALPLTTVSWGKNHLDIYGRGTDGAVYQKFWNNDAGKWEGWNKIGDNTFNDAPKAVCWSPGRVDLFVVGKDNALWHNWWEFGANSNQWGGWENLGGYLKTGTLSVVSQAKGKLDIFGIGGDDAMYVKRFDNGWQDWKLLGGKFLASGGSSAVSQTDGTLNVFGVGLDKGLYHLSYFNNEWSRSSWESLGGKVDGRPSAVSLGLGHVSVLIKGGDGGLYENRYSDLINRFDGFKRLGGTLTDSPFAWIEGNNIHVLMRAPKNEMRYKGWRDPHVNVAIRLIKELGKDKMQKRF